MGSSSQKTSSTTNSKTGPWGPAAGPLESLLGMLQGQFKNAGVTGAENRALQGLQGNIKYTNEYLPQMQSLLDDLFKGGGLGEGAEGIRTSWATANNALTPIARGDFVSPESNPYIQSIVGKTQGDLKNTIGGMFSGAGRSFSGAHMNALGSGIGDATNALYYNAYSGERDRQSQAARDLMSGSVGTAAGLDATLGAKLGARAQGAEFAPRVTGMRDDPYLKQLELSGMKRNLPLQNLGALSGLLLPIAGMGSTGQSTTNSTTTQNANPWQTAIGGALGLAGLAGGMPGLGGLSSMFGSQAGGGGKSPQYWMNPWSNFFSGRGLY